MALTPEQIESEKTRLNNEIAERQTKLQMLTLLAENKVKLQSAKDTIFGFEKTPESNRPKINDFSIKLDLTTGEKMVSFITIEGVKTRFDSGGDWQDRLYGALKYMLDDATATIQADETELLESL